MYPSFTVSNGLLNEENKLLVKKKDNFANTMLKNVHTIQFY